MVMLEMLNIIQDLLMINSILMVNQLDCNYYLIHHIWKLLIHVFMVLLRPFKILQEMFKNKDLLELSFTEMLHLQDKELSLNLCNSKICKIILLEELFMLSLIIKLDLPPPHQNKDQDYIVLKSEKLLELQFSMLMLMNQNQLIKLCNQLSNTNNNLRKTLLSISQVIENTVIMNWMNLCSHNQSCTIKFIK